MSVTLLAPEVRRMLADLARRVGILERRITPTAVTAAAGSNDDLVFSYAGVLVVGESPPVKVRYDGFLMSLAVALGTAGSTSTVLEVKQNGSVIATVTIPSSTSDYVPDIGVRVYGEDRLSLRIATAGTSAANLTAMARFT